MPFTIERNDLSTMHVDAVVVAANERLRITGGVGATVAKVAGFEQLQEACEAIGECPTGQAVVTPGFDLPATYVVHAVGPVWDADDSSCKTLLQSAYDSALTCAYEAGARSIALPLISAGTYGCPSEISFAVAMQSVRAFLDDHDADVHVVLYSRSAVRAGLALYGEIAQFIDDNYVDEQHVERLAAARDYFDAYTGGSARADAYERREPQPQRQRPGILGRLGEAVAERFERLREADEEEETTEIAAVEEARDVERIKEVAEAFERAEEEAPDACAPAMAPMGAAPAPAAPAASAAPMAAAPKPAAPAATVAVAAGPVSSQSGLRSQLDHLDAPFSTTLLAMIDARGLKDAQVYKRANMSRQLFSKIRSDADYRPTKKTVLALALALQLSLDETADLLSRAGFALSSSNKADVIVRYFIGNGIYDIFTVNEALYAFDQPLL